MNLPRDDQYDATLIGGGWAGQALARQLRRRLPSLRVLIVDSAESFDWKVGEATVDLAAHYLLQRLGLSTYLYRNQLPKNGLRFFFNDAAASARLVEASELGSTFLPPIPTFQLNRQRFDSDLRKMNVADGVESLLGVICDDVSLGKGGELHTVRCRDGERNVRSIQTRWLVDASGRRRFLGRKLDLHHETDVVHNCAAWGRFKGTSDIDVLGDDAWRKRVSYTARFLSTIHFAGRGYWIWFIPLSGDLMSVGVVSSKDILENPPLRKEEFLDFINNHRAAREVLGNGELIDFMAYPQLAYRCSTLYSRDRWAATGFAGMFQDPYFSLGGDVIAYGNDYITDLIDKDFVGKVSQDALSVATVNYNAAMQRVYDRTKIWMDGAYACMGSFSIFSVRYTYELCIYYLDYVWGFMCTEHLESMSAERRQLTDHFFHLENILREQILDTVSASLANGIFYGKNTTAEFAVVASYVSPFIFQIGQSGMWRWRLDMMLKIWLFSYLRITALKFGLEQVAEREIVQDIMTLPKILERHPFDQKDLDCLLNELGETLAVRLEAEFGVKPDVTVSTENFGEGRILLQRSKHHDAISANMATKMQARCDELWSRKRAYDQLPNQLQQLFRAFRRPTFQRSQTT
jgi:flavin-dependent dehydrogenase